MTKVDISQYPYPRRQPLRRFLRQLARMAFAVLSDFHIIGKENIPDKGPLLVVANHFHFADPVAVIRATPWPIEFVGGTQMPNAPSTVTFIPKWWGYFPVHRGGASLGALRAATAVLEQDGILGIFPEAGNWASVLRPARPGAAFLAAETNAPILPIGIDGLTELFPTLWRGRHARVTVRIGRPFGPFNVQGRGRARRQQIEQVGEIIMRKIAELIPSERRGVFSDDPRLRAEAELVADYPWNENPERSRRKYRFFQF